MEFFMAHCAPLATIVVFSAVNLALLAIIVCSGTLFATPAPKFPSSQSIMMPSVPTIQVLGIFLNALSILNQILYRCGLSLELSLG